MLKMVDGTGIIGVDMVCPLGGAVSPPKPPNYDKVEVEGVGSLMLPNSLKAHLERVELIGNSVQGENPAPENPQEIKSAGKWNEGTQKYEVDVKVTGKNLLDIKDITSETPQWLEIPCLIKNNIYIKSNNSTVLVENNQARLIVCFKDGTSRAMYDNLMTNGLPFKANSENPITTIKVRGTHIKSGMYSDIQVEYGNEPTPYEPYTEQTLTLTSDRPITKWDKLVEQGEEYGWLYQSVAKEYIGDNSVELYDTGFYFKLSDKKIVNGEGYCEELKQYVHREENPCIAFKMSANIYAYTLNTQEIYGSTVSEIKEYLKSHPLHLVYKTEATEFVPLSESEQTQLRNLHSYNGTTNITVDSGEIPCGIKLTYRKEK